MLAFDFNGVVGDIASIATIVAAFAGSIFALRYGRKANATVAGTAQRLPSGAVVISARLSVQSSGFRSLKMIDPKSASVTLLPIVMRAGELQILSGEKKEGFLAEQIVVPGETVTTSVEFPIDAPSHDVVGWNLYFRIKARHLSGSWTWEDTNFVARPAPDKSDGAKNPAS